MFQDQLLNNIIAGKKTETRRIHSFNHLPEGGTLIYPPKFEFKIPLNTKGGVRDCDNKLYKPSYKKGGLVYIKEPYFEWEADTSAGPTNMISYKLDKINDDDLSEYDWKNKMFMPEKYARHFLGINDVFAQKLLDINEDQACAEFCGEPIGGQSYRNLFLETFREISGIKDLSNIYCWVYKFTLLTKLNNNYVRTATQQQWRPPVIHHTGDASCIIH